MVKIALPLLVVIIFVGCKGSVVRTQAEAQKNRKLILSLDIGMTEDQVLATMGKPKKKEKYSRNDRTIEFWFYLTEGYMIDDGKFRDSDYTPLGFEGGKLIGWGRSFYDRALQYESEIETK